MQQYQAPGNSAVPEGFDLDNVLDNFLVQLSHQAEMAHNGATQQQQQLLQGLGQNMGDLNAGMLPRNVQGTLMNSGGPMGVNPPGQMGLDPALLARLAGDGSQAPSALHSNAQQSGRGRTRGNHETKTARAKPTNNDSDAVSSDASASSGEQKSRKKREVYNDDDMSAAERRHQALQEKNRRAQRRFRERQKARIQDLHKQIEELTVQVGNLQTENAALHSRTSILEKVLDMRNEQIQVMQESKEITQQVDDNLDAPPLTLTAVSGQSISLTADMLKALSPQQIYKIYQTYIKELSARLVELNKGTEAAPEVTAQVEKLTKEVSFLLMRLSVVRPIETRKFIAVSRQYLSTEQEAISMWRDVVSSINLSDKQKLEIVQWKQLFMQKVEPIVEGRKKLNIQIQSHLPQESFHTRNAITYIKTHEAVAKLRENLRAEHNVTIEFCAAVFKGVLNSFQMASLLVQAYPAVPDALAVASAVIAEMAEKGETVPAMAQGMPQMDGINGLSVAPPLLCPTGDQNPNAPQTAAAAAAAAAAAGVSQGAAIGLGAVPSSQPLPLLQTLHAMQNPDVGPGGSNAVAAAAVEALMSGQINGWPGQPVQQQQQQQ